MLIALSNLNYLTCVTVPAIEEVCRKATYVPHRPELFNAMKSNVDEEIETLVTGYLESKGEPALGRMESAMYEDGFQWNFKGQVTTVSFYLREVLLAVVSMHAQVLTLCPPFLDKIIAKMTENAAEELYRLFSCVTRFSLDGALQAHVDLAAFKEALRPKITTQAKKFLQEAEHFLPPLSGQQYVENF
jgi:exocyst complex component 2